MPKAENTYVPAGYSEEELVIDKYDNGVLSLLFSNSQLDTIEIDLGQFVTDSELPVIEDVLNLNWLRYAKLLKFDEFLSISKLIKGIQILRVLQHKGWIGYGNEVLLIKPHNFFFSFFADESLALRRIETKILPLPNYEYEDVT